ncbi:hypothetical protein [Stenotrophomonas acidaminiphila]|uniref:hypothetical protein n=1 Tax=Stenotrophomonas acidaminiphila TaxID=128780 RepID=UPI00289F79D6|nr:hypothetical protein [Stenotrophomonas acidaminiphila]
MEQRQLGQTRRWIERHTAKTDMKCNVDPNWLQDFDTALKRYFLIDHAEAGMGETELARYADLRPHDAALQYGEDYDLQRVDIDWVSPTRR